MEKLKKHIEKLKEKVLKPEERKDYIKQLFGEHGEPLMFKMLIEDAILVGEEDGIKKTIKEFFKKFDKYSWIKNDKWYLNLKKELNSEGKFFSSQP